MNFSKCFSRFLVRFFHLFTKACLYHIRQTHFVFVFLQSFYYFWDEESERKISLSFWITFACRLIWSTYLILLFFNKYFLSFLTFSRVFEKYICYLLTLCSRRKQSEAFFSFTWKTWKTWLYQVWSQCSHHVETIYLICMTNRINGVLYDYKAACKCLN